TVCVRRKSYVHSNEKFRIALIDFFDGSCDLMAGNTRIRNERIPTPIRIQVCATKSYIADSEQSFSGLSHRERNVLDLNRPRAAHYECFHESHPLRLIPYCDILMGILSLAPRYCARSMKMTFLKSLNTDGLPGG